MAGMESRSERVEHGRISFERHMQGVVSTFLHFPTRHRPEWLETRDGDYGVGCLGERYDGATRQVMLMVGVEDLSNVA